MSKSSSMKKVLIFLTVYPFMLRGSYVLMQQFFDIPYKDGECFLKLINETNHQHYVDHPLWSYHGYDTDCNAIDYARKQGLENEFENKIMKKFGQAQLLFGFGYMAYNMAFSVESLFIGWVGGMLTQYSMHYQHDLMHFVGNLVHHAGSHVMHETGKGGAKFGESIPHGLMPNFVGEEICLQACMFVAHKLTNQQRSFWEFAAMRTVISLVKMKIQTSIVHPFLHAEKESMFPWPLSKIIEDFDCHIVKHHEDGTCLGVIDSFPTNALYDKLMFAQAWFYKTGIVKRNTGRHEVLTYTLEYIIIFLAIAIYLAAFKFSDGVKKVTAPLFKSSTASSVKAKAA